MRRFCSFGLILAFVLIAISLLFVGIYFWPTPEEWQSYVPLTQKEGFEWLLPVWMTSFALLLGAAILCTIGKRRESLSLVAAIIALVGALMSLVVALAFKGALPIKVGSNVSINFEQGLDAWKLIYRHLTAVAAGVLAAVCGFINYGTNRQERIRIENEQYVDQYELPESADTEEPHHKLKKSQRVAQRKNEE